MATWHYTNSSGSAVVLDFPNLNALQDANLAPGQALTFNDSGDNYMTVYEDPPTQTITRDGETIVVERVRIRGKVQDIAQPGYGPT